MGRKRGRKYSLYKRLDKAYRLMWDLENETVVWRYPEDEWRPGYRDWPFEVKMLSNDFKLFAGLVKEKPRLCARLVDLYRGCVQRALRELRNEPGKRMSLWEAFCRVEHACKSHCL